MSVNSNQKGKRGERQWAKVLSEVGFPARRGRQFQGSPESPDVRSTLDGLIYWEVKRQNNRQISVWYDKAVADAPHSTIPVLAHRRDNRPWVCTLALLNLAKMQGWQVEGEHQTLYNGPGKLVEAYLRSQDAGRVFDFIVHDKRSLHLGKYLDLGTEQAPKHLLPAIAHRRPLEEEMWLVSMWAEVFFEIMTPYAMEKGVMPSVLQESL